MFQKYLFPKSVSCLQMPYTVSTSCTMSHSTTTIQHFYYNLGLDARKPVFGAVNNKGADQLVHPHSLINTFVIRLLEKIISKLATGEISIF